MYAVLSLSLSLSLWAVRVASSGGFISRAPGQYPMGSGCSLEAPVLSCVGISRRAARSTRISISFGAHDKGVIVSRTDVR